MRRLIGLIAVTVLIGAMPTLSFARPPRNGTVMTPFGSAYDTGSPEWKQSGGNIFVYQQLMEQKAYQQQQMMLLKQHQQMLQMQKKNGGLKAPTGSNASVFNAPAPISRRKKKRHVVTSTPSATSAVSKTADKSAPAKTARPAAESDDAKATAKPS